MEVMAVFIFYMLIFLIPLIIIDICSYLEKRKNRGLYPDYYVIVHQDETGRKWVTYEEKKD